MLPRSIRSVHRVKCISMVTKRRRQIAIRRQNVVMIVSPSATHKHQPHLVFTWYTVITAPRSTREAIL